MRLHMDGRERSMGSTNNGLPHILLSLILAVLCGVLYFTYETHVIVRDNSEAQQEFAEGMEASVKEFAMLTVLKNSDESKEEATPLQYERVDGSFVYFRPIVINIDSEAGKRHFLRLKIVLDVTDGAVDEVVRNIPVILDRVHAVLRTKTLSDFRGEAGTQTIHGSIKAAIESRLAADTVKEILFQEMLIQ